MRPNYRFSKRVVDGIWILFVKVKYPKFLIILFVVILAYWSFSFETVQSFFHSLGGAGYISAFAGGVLFAFGFGAPFGVAILLSIADDVNIFAAAIIAGLGALLSDYLLFKFIRVTFTDEVEKLRRSKPIHLVNGVVRDYLPPKVMSYITAGIAGFVIASPLPDEIGVTILSLMADVRERIFAIISFSLNTIGILAILVAGTVI
jgi:hypothetical protein